MRPLTWLFPALTLTFVGLLMLAGRNNPHPAQVAKYLEQNFRSVEQVSLAAGENLGAFNQSRGPEGPTLPLSTVQTGVGLTFSHIGDGLLFAGSEQFLQTTLFLVNSSGRNTTGSVEFYDNDGLPLELTIDGVKDSVFPFELIGRASKRFVTSGEGPAKSGWAHVHSEQPLSGTASFGIRDHQDTIYTAVGVAESELGEAFTLFADSTGPSNTGVALANPDFVNGITVTLDLFDASGQMLASTTRDLLPGGHLAEFIHQLFPGVAGIKDFEGSIVLSSDDEFAGTTLRTTGNQLTSMPMIGALPEGADWTNLAFSHIGVGAGGGLRMQTAIVLFNNTGAPATGRVDFLASSGLPMSVIIDGQQNSTFTFELQPGAVLRMVTEPTGDLRSGWAEVTMDQPIDGTALFSIFDTRGRLLTEVGVPSSHLYQGFELIADSLGAFNTGIALANPAEAGDPVTIEFRIYNQLGVYKTLERRTLGPREHTAFFMDDLFPELPGVEDIKEFDGKLEVSASGWLAPLCLRQANIKLTSMPTLLTRPGFAPGSSLIFSQKLSGTAPAFQWQLFQRSGELSLSSVRLTAPEVGINQDLVEPGQKFAIGLSTGGGGDQIMELSATGKGSTLFQIISAGAKGRRITASGRLNGSRNEGFELKIDFDELEPYTVLAGDPYVWLFFPPGLLLVPEGTESVEFTTEFTSVSMDPLKEMPILRRQMQTETFQVSSPEYSNITGIEPLFLEGGESAVIRGSNFAEDSEIILRTLRDSRFHVEPLEITDTEVRFIVPTDFFDSREIRVADAQGYYGNRYQSYTLFSPIFDIQQGISGGGSGDWVFRFSQSGRAPQLLASEFEVTIINANFDPESLVVGSVVGKVDKGNSYLGRELVVRSTQASQAVLDMKYSWSEDVWGTLTVERVSDETNGLRLTFEEAEYPAGPALELGLTWEWRMTGLPIHFEGADEVRDAVARTLSTPFGYGGREEAIENDQVVLFLWN